MIIEFAMVQVRCRDWPGSHNSVIAVFSYRPPGLLAEIPGSTALFLGKTTGFLGPDRQLPYMVLLRRHLLAGAGSDLLPMMWPVAPADRQIHQPKFPL